MNLNRFFLSHNFRLKVSEPRKSLDETDDAEESSDDERSYETPEEKRKHFYRNQ